MIEGFAFSEDELVTMPLDMGIVLPGVTRDSVLSLAREWVGRFFFFIHFAYI